jgi:glucosylceramidase
VNDSLSYQTMSGFGAAFTDSSAYLMNQLKGFSSTSYSTLMNQLFSTSSGVGLSSDDTGFIIPTIKDALAINPSIQIVASPWSAPTWMKSNGSMFGSTSGTNGTLFSSDYQAWADYFRDWIEAYQGKGVPIFAVTAQNEPRLAG